MKRLLKGTLLILAMALIIGCQAQVTKSTFEEVPVDEDLTPNISIPSDSKDEIDKGEQETPDKPLTELSEAELSILEPESFFMHLKNPYVETSRLIEFNFSGDRINKKVLNSEDTEVVIKVKLLSRAGGRLEYMRQGIRIHDASYNNYYIVYDTILTKALPELGTYAEYKVDVYIKDKRKTIQYLMTHRTFEFRVYGHNF